MKISTWRDGTEGNAMMGDNSSLISDKLVEKALHTLSTTSQEAAAARAIRLRTEHNRKRVRAEIILKSREKTADLRIAAAESSHEYELACDKEIDAVEQDEFIRAERNDAAIILESWRTEEASRRAGSNFR